MKTLAFLMALLTAGIAVSAPARAAPQYLAFQIFTGSYDANTGRLSAPPAPVDVAAQAEDIRSRIDTPDTRERKLGFILGPIAFDDTDDQVTALITGGFDIALQRNMAVGFHIDDSIFWGRIRTLALPGSIEWLDWSGLPSRGRRLDWSSKPMRVAPQLCLNSKGVTDAVAARAAVIGHAVERGLRKLHAAGKDDLFIGVIAGWETQMGRDYKTGAALGFCAFTNKGYSAQNPPPDADAAREEVLRDFIDTWSRALARNGVPPDRIYAHVAFMSKTAYDLARRLTPSKVPPSYLEAAHATPPETAFGPAHAPGFSTYPEPGHLEQIAAQLKAHGSPGWISAAGTALAPPYAGQPAHPTDMEEYLGNLFGNGARAVNIFGWGLAGRDNMVRDVAESDASIAAYRKFLRGDALTMHPLPLPQIPSADWIGKTEKIQNGMPGYVSRHGIGAVKPLMDRLETQSKALQFADAEKTADEILNLIGK